MDEVLLRSEVPGWRDECAAQYRGLWLIQPDWFLSAWHLVRAGTLVALSRADDEDGKALYGVTPGGVAVIQATGQLMKGTSKYGGTSSVRLRQGLREASRDKAVRGILLVLDSPGGTVAGTDELAEDVRRADLLVPVHAHVDDLGASAAYWVASQARRLTASRTSEVGSIGVLSVLVDSSKSAEEEGLQVHVIATGPYKGTGVPGAPITEAQLAYVRGRVEDLHEHFLAAVAQGRRVSVAQAREWATGETWIAEKAKALGLIDDVRTMDEAVRDLEALVAPKEPPPARRGEILRAEILQAESRR